MVSKTLVIIFVAMVTSPSTWAMSELYRHRMEALRSSLLTNYSAHFPPLKDPDVYLPVRVQFAVSAILDLNDAKQILSTLVYMTVFWEDPDLKWDPHEAGSPGEGIQSLHISPDDIWTPQLQLANSARETQVLRHFDLANIWYGGFVEAHMAVQFQTTCKVDVERYPFDTQICRVIFASLYGSKLNLTGQQLDIPLLKHFDVSGEWSLRDVTINEKQIVSENLNYTFLEYSLHLKRGYYFYVLTVIFPMVLLSVTGACGFLLPLQCGEKVSFQVAIMVSLAVFLSFINDAMPKTSTSFSRLAIYVDMLLMESCFAFLATLTVLRGHFHIEKIQLEDKERRAAAKEPAGLTVARDEDKTTDITTWQAVNNRWRRLSRWVRSVVRRWYCCCCCIPPHALDIFFFVVFVATAIGGPYTLFVLY